MTKNEITELLKAGPVSIEFTKANGEVRFMVSTLNENIVPPTTPTVEGALAEEERKRVKSDDALPVWSVDDHGWRSFRWDRLIRVNDVDVEGLFTTEA